MSRSHPVYFVCAMIIAALLQYLLVRRMIRTTDVKHGEANLANQDKINEP